MASKSTRYCDAAVTESLRARHPMTMPIMRPRPRPRPHPRPRRRRRPPRILQVSALGAAGGLLAGLVACGSPSPGEVEDRAPTITVTGVAEGQELRGEVTITISVDVGTYQAFLNGEVFTSGRRLSDPGDYALRVDARNGSATSSVTISFSIVFSGESFLIVRMFDLGANDAGGGGDAILLTDSSENGQRHILLDAGPQGVGGADAAFVSRQLQALGIDTLDAVILSHAHTDHFGGLTDVFQTVAVIEEFIYNGQVRNFAAYTTFVAFAQTRAQTTTVPTAVESRSIGLGAVRTSYEVIPPLPTYLGNPDASASEINEGSLGVLVEKANVRIFFTGDGEVEANQRWRTVFSTETAGLDILKVGHHQANDAVFDNGFNGVSAWLAHTDPTHSVASANGDTHPRVNATNALLGRPLTEVRCTNVHGTIEIRVNDAGQFTMSVEKNDGDPCAPGANAST